MSNPTCPRCGERPRRDGQGYCDRCIAEYRREYRREQISAYSDEDSIYAKTVLPDTIFKCKFCGCSRQAHKDRPGYGDFFESQAEADTCCGRGESSTVPFITEEYAPKHGYAQALVRALIGQNIQQYGQTQQTVATKYLPTLHYGGLGDFI